MTKELTLSIALAPRGTKPRSSRSDQKSCSHGINSFVFSHLPLTRLLSNIWQEIFRKSFVFKHGMGGGGYPKTTKSAIANSLTLGSVPLRELRPSAGARSKNSKALRVPPCLRASALSVVFRDAKSNRHDGGTAT
jgi:hypothetical protein